MRILQISSAKTFGSRERHFIDLCKGLQARGHEVFVVVRPTSQWTKQLRFLPKQNIYYLSIRNSFGIFRAQKIAQIIREKQIEKVHAHLARDYFPTSLACRLAKTAKFYLTRHSSSPMKSFFRFALTNLEKSIALSEKMKGDLERIFPKHKVALVRDGIELPNLSLEAQKKMREDFFAENNIPADSYLIGTIGELREEKGQQDFILAAKIVAEKYPNSYFVIVGEEPFIGKSFRRDLKRMVKIFGLEKRFLWFNWMEDFTVFLNALDVLVAPVYDKKFNWTILEAMANKKAVVVTDNDFVLHNETGIMIEKKEPAQFAEAIQRLLKDESSRKGFGEKAQLSIKENFSMQNMIDETERVYSANL